MTLTIWDADDVRNFAAIGAGPELASLRTNALEAIRMLIDEAAEQKEEHEQEQRQLLDRAEEAEHKLTLIADHLDEAHRMLNRMLASGARPTKAALLLALAQVNHARDKANEG